MTWRTGQSSSTWAASLRPHFDVFVESAAEGLRKPDLRIYEIVCERLGIEPAEAVFLDDIWANLKTARALGMASIRAAAGSGARRTGRSARLRFAVMRAGRRGNAAPAA